MSTHNLAGTIQHHRAITGLRPSTYLTFWTGLNGVRGWLRFKNRAKFALLVAATCISGFAASGSSVAAQEVHALPVEDAVKLRYFGELSPFGFSPDGEWLAYVVRDNQKSIANWREAQTRTGVPWHAIGANIYVLSLKTGEKINITGGRSNNWLPTWSRDGRLLAFLSDRDDSGQARVWIWNATKNELRKVSDVNVRGNQIEWMPDGNSLFVTTVPRALSPQDYAHLLSSGRKPPDEEARKTLDTSVILYQAASPSPNPPATPMSDAWNLDLNLRDLVSMDISSGKTTWIVRNQRIAKYLLSPDGSHIAYSRPNHFEKAGSQQILFDILTVDVLGKEERTLASNVRLDYDGAALSWSPSSSQLSFRTGGTEETTHDCYVVDLTGTEASNLTHFQTQHASNRKSVSPLWDARGKNVYFIHDGALFRASVGQEETVKVAQIPNREIRLMTSQSDNELWTTNQGRSTVVVTHDDFGKQDGFYTIDLASGESAKLLERGQCYTCTQQDHIVAIAQNQQLIAYFAEDARSDSDIWVSAPDFQNPHRITHINPQFDAYEMGAVRLISWLSMDGEELRGALLLPSGYQEGRRYPLIVWVYGGRALSNRLDQFGLAGSGPFNLQLLATRGYAVLLPDAPQHPGTPMLDLVKTVLPGVNKTIELGIADAARLGILGHSYGGYSSLALIAQTKRFKAAMAIDGIGDLATAYGQLDANGTAFQTSVMESGQGLMMGPPWQFPGRYIENSPIFYIDRVETPLFIVHGAEDRTVAPFLSDEVFVALRRLGKKVVYAKYQGEDHSPPNWSSANQMDLCNRMIAWFDLYLGSNTSSR